MAEPAGNSLARRPWRLRSALLSAESQIPGPPSPTRDFTVAVFVVWNGAILLHFHEKLGRWLPPGGHIEPNEIPDHAAHREVLEETGIEITLVGDQLNTIDISGQPRQCCRPAGVQIATIRPGHEHVDLIYFARSEGGEPHENAGWFGPDSWSVLQLTAEVQTWCELAIESVDKWARKSSRVRT